MKTTCTALLIGGLIVSAPPPAAAQTPVDLRPMIVTNLTGQLRVQQGVPCGGIVDLTTPVTGGRLLLTPAEGLNVAGGKLFALTRSDVFFAGFSVTRTCSLITETRTYTEVGVQLGRAVSFTAASAGADLFAVTIPKSDFLLYQAAVVNGQLETSFQKPSQDVTGAIDFTARTVTLRVVVATRVRFRAGCVFDACIIDEVKDGTLTADIGGTIFFPDTDGDGVADRSDNCKLVANADQSPVATPIITAPSDVTLASCVARDFGIASAVDRCDGGPVIVTSDAPAAFVVGANAVTWQAQDAKSRTATATQTVTVVDTTPPILTSVPADIAVNTCGPVDLGLPTATDDCAGTPAFTSNAPASFGVGTTVVTWTATDASGNTAAGGQIVTVTDAVAPAVSCAPAAPPGRAFQAIATDACSGAPTLRLGTFVLANGETIKIEEVGRPGVRLVNEVSTDGIRHFQVGKGEAVILATDASGNVGSAICR